MRKLIAVLLILSLVLMTGLSGAAMWDLKKMILGDDMIPAEGNGAPWFADDSKLYFGTGKDAYISYNADKDALETIGDNITITIPLTTSQVDGSAWIADDNYEVIQIAEVHTVAQNTAYPNDGRLTLVKLNSTTAPGSGWPLHNTTLKLNSTVETVVRPTLNTTAGSLNLDYGQRIGLNFNGTMTTFAGGSVTVTLRRR